MKTKTMQFVAELTGFKPRMWRRILVSSEMELEEFCYVLMKTFRANGGHLFSFEKDGDTYELENEYDDGFISFMEPKDISKYHVDQLFSFEKEHGLLTYDFGDNWEIKVTLENSEVADSLENKLPRVIKGKGFGIIEDVGGVWGLSEIDEMLRTHDKKAMEKFKDWVGPRIMKLPDLTVFSKEDIDEVNQEIQSGDLKEFYSMDDIWSDEDIEEVLNVDPLVDEIMQSAMKRIVFDSICKELDERIQKEKLKLSDEQSDELFDIMRTYAPDFDDSVYREKLKK
ncbi:plasmid pRiA4b ORF-3 family protein [Lactovum odontotermitis]